MDALDRLVTDSLVRHGFNRPIDPRRLQWSRWYPCHSLKSLLVVPSKPGIFAIAEEVAALGGASELRSSNPERTDRSRDFATIHVGTAALGCPAGQSPAAVSAASNAVISGGAHTTSSVETIPSKPMLAVLQFSEADDMAFTLDRLFTRPSPMRDRLTSGRCHLRFVTLGDDAQRHSICSALNQWMASSAQKAIGFEEERFVVRAFHPATANPVQPPPQAPKPTPINMPDSGSNKNNHCPQPVPSGF